MFPKFIQPKDPPNRSYRPVVSWCFVTDQDRFFHRHDGHSTGRFFGGERVAIPENRCRIRRGRVPFRRGATGRTPTTERTSPSIPDGGSGTSKFRSHEFRPYRPPRFADGEFTPTVINALKADWGVEIQFRTINPNEGSDWGVLVGGERIETIERSRSGEGYVEYHITGEEFEDLVRSAVDH